MSREFHFDYSNSATIYVNDVGLLSLKSVPLSSDNISKVNHAAVLAADGVDYELLVHHPINCNLSI